MADERTVTRGLRLRAAVCQVCPLCIVARRWPRSTFARTLGRLEKTCPFCRAYARLHGPRS